MPELPEVETIVRGLRCALVGETISRVQIRWPGCVAAPVPEEFAQGLPGVAIASVSRRGKYILIETSSKWLVVHLRMTGSLTSLAAADESLDQDKHVHVVISFASGRRLYFRDVRKFGRLWATRDPDSIVAGLGPEPLSEAFTPAMLWRLLQSRRRQLKPALLDQTFLAGLGNIYVDEALWLAGLYPLRRTHTLTEHESAQLYAAIRHVLGDALAHGGTTLRDYRAADGEAGGHQHRLAAYGREGEPCRRCGEAIVRTVVGQRGTHYCPVCQQGPDRAATIDEEAQDG